MSPSCSGFRPHLTLRGLILSLALGCGLLIAAPGPARGTEARLARHPAPSPDASVLAFSWQGDLWVAPANGGQARRLTVHPASDRHPVWSPDGRWVAFASDRHGPPDVYILPVDASSPPRRLTYNSTLDHPVDFTADGSAVLFLSRRDESIRRGPTLYRIPVTGGTPVRDQLPLARDARLSHDGQRMVLVRGHRHAQRLGYRGAANRDLWLRGPDDGFQVLTSFQGDDDHPSWLSDGQLVFRSERDGRKNLYTFDLETGEVRALTRHRDFDVRYPRASRDGRLVAYEHHDGIRTLHRDPEGRWKDEPVAFSVASGLLDNPMDRRVETSGAEELAIHPEETHAALILQGDVFVVALASKEDQEIAPPPTLQVTATIGREKDLSWTPDGEALVYASDREGSYDLYEARPDGEDPNWSDAPGFLEKRLTRSKANEHTPRVSPDGGAIVFLRGKGDLTLLDRDSGRETELRPHWGSQDFVWSPDGKWIATSHNDMDYNSEIWILPREGGEAYNVSRHPDDDVSPHWSPDGRRLLWTTRRHDDSMDIWAVWLRREDHEKSPAQWLATWKGEGREEKSDEAEKGKKKKKKKDGDASEAPELPEVSIDFDELWRRVRSVTDLLGDEGLPVSAPESRRVYFTAEPDGERDLYSVRWNGEDRKRLTSGGAAPSAVQLSADGKTLYYLSKGSISRISDEGKAGDPIPFRARRTVDKSRERAAVFDEAWSALNEWYYDPDFHGISWEEQRSRYRPLALAASHPDDFANMVNLMLGELNSSHMGYFHPRGGGDGQVTGYIGARFDPSRGGPGLLIRDVLTGSPAARVDVDLKPGDRLLEVEGEPVGPEINVWSLFNDTVGRKIRLRVLSTKGKERTVSLEPHSFGTQRQLVYKDWVRASRDLVEEASGGRLGYLHIQGMNTPSFEEFERDLYAAGEGKEGLIIDVRSNGGGWTTDYLMAVLNVRRHARTVPRDADPSVKAYPQSRLPLAAWTRPALALCNQESFSNAEIFSWAFQTLDRGTLVGVPTYGGVISTGGTRLLNGGWIRLPLRGWYVAGSGINMENNGAVPDVRVDQPPEQDAAPRPDRQLERAVEVFMEGLEEDPRYGSW